MFGDTQRASECAWVEEGEKKKLIMRYEYYNIISVLFGRYSGCKFFSLSEGGTENASFTKVHS